ncbi:hypothetical protein ACPPVU_15950 [Mucilaginibacter sp. McL0603]|uniref:hypothetical protein n=1 Tax=Mucilaginibacter sp. McL0603 TaxID=3415670 RepID=UPI003CE685F0
MRKITFLLLTVSFLFACKKNHDITPSKDNKTSYTDKIVLNDPQVTGDSLKISWSMLDTAVFANYTLLRKDYSDGQMNSIKQLYQKNQTFVYDNAVPYSPTVQYQVVGSLASGQTISSNVISYSRPNIQLLNVSPFDIIYSDNDQVLYFFEKSGKISIYSIAQNTIIKSVNTMATIGYCDLGTYNGRKELYVPRNDGWVFIYDATTLEKIDQISTGLSNSCVVFNNNNLYVSTAAWTMRPLKVYSRINGTKISENGDFELTRFKHVPNTDFDLLEITINIGPTDQDYYHFSTSGVFLSHTNDLYHGDYPLDASIFEFFPDGSKYITSSSGAIYNKDMTYQISLPRGNLSFTTFVLNQTEKLIYAGCQTKNIEVYSMTDYNHVRTISTKAYPYKIFDMGNQLLCISSATGSNCIYCTPSINNIVIEKVNK